MILLSSCFLKYLFISPLVLIGVFTSYSDIKYGKIKNRQILFGLAYILILYLFLFAYGWGFLRQLTNVKYLSELMVNAAVAIIFGYILWYFNLWAAGDAKLFFLYALLVPLEFYNKSYIPYFPSGSLLVDTFFLICLFFLTTIIIKFFYQLIKTIKSHFPTFANKITLNYVREYLRRFNYKIVGRFILNTGKVLLVYVVFILFIECLGLRAIGALHSMISKPLNVYIIFFGSQLFIVKLFSKNKYFVSVLLILGIIESIILVINHINPVSVILKPSILFMILFNMAIQLVYSYIENHEVAEIRFAQLHAGMVLTTDSVQQIHSRAEKYGLNINVNMTGADGLNEQQVKELKEVYDDSPEAILHIYKTIPYAPFMFVAFLVTIVSHGSILSQFLCSLHLQN